MQQMKLLSLVAAALVLLSPTVGLAEITPQAYTLSPFAGAYIFEDDEQLRDNNTLYGLALGYNFSERWAAEFAGSYLMTRDDVPAVDVEIDVYRAQIDLLYHFFPTSPVNPYLAAGGGAMAFDPADGQDTDIDGFFNYGLGMKIFMSPSVALRLDARHIFAGENVDFHGREQENFAFTGGLLFQFGGAEPAPAVKDSDGDGVEDNLDSCPDTPLGTAVDASGCSPDSDGDGIADPDDRCPDTEAGATVDSAGCPTDSDLDGVADHRDRCPGTEAGVEVDSAGCPEEPVILDGDGDGVPDEADRCPDTPSGTPVTEDGCPVPVELELNVEFSTGSATLSSTDNEALRQAAQVIEANPGARFVVEGHTDSVGPSAYNLTLSQRRAQAVRDFLVNRLGIAPERIEAVGYGEDRPVAENSTPEGRQLNRRVVLRVKN